MNKYTHRIKYKIKVYEDVYTEYFCLENASCLEIPNHRQIYAKIKTYVYIKFLAKKSSLTNRNNFSRVPFLLRVLCKGCRKSLERKAYLLAYTPDGVEFLAYDK